MKTIAVFGLPGTGKTMLARELASRLGLPHTSLDDILFTPTGPLALEEFRRQAAAVTAGDAWIVEGNYSKLADVVWHRADVLVWLDYGLPLIMWRVTRRSLRHLTGREPNTHGTTFKTAFIGRTSMLGNAVRKYRHNRPRYARQAQETAALGVEVVRLHSPRETAQWLNQQLPH